MTGTSDLTDNYEDKVELDFNRRLIAKFAITRPPTSIRIPAIAVHCLAAARWLADSGDPEQAARLLRWVDAPQLLHEGTVYGIMLSGPTYLERARVERRMGRSAQAAEDYREFLRRVDRPTPRYRAHLDEAREAL